MSGISVKSTGSFDNLYDFLNRASKSIDIETLKKYGAKGVEALSSHTPKDSGETASSWTYTIENENGQISLSWHNTNIVDNVNVAIILQYGHATKNGKWVEGIDYINPALKTVFDELAEACWKEITNG